MVRARKLWLAATLGATAGLLTWGSWQPPSLSSYARPSQFVLLDAPGLRAGADSARLQAQLAALPGVSAFALRPAKQLAVVAFNPDSLSQEQLCRRLGLTARPVPPPSSTARQCPVPAGYVQALEKIRFTLNIRRAFVQL